MSDIYLSITETPAVVTLSQPVISGALAATVTVGNTVTVALDANSLSALENVTVTVGAAVSVSNFPATQVVSVSNLPATQPVSLASLPGSTVTVANFPATQAVSGTVTANTGLTQPLTDAQLRASAVTVALDSTSLNALENVTVTVGAAVTVAGFSTSSLPPSTVTVGNSVTIGNFPSTQTVAGTVTANLGSPSQQELENITQEAQIISGKLNSVTIGSLPAISGTVTANVGGIASGVTIPVRLFAETEGGTSSGQDTLLNCDSSGQLLVNLKSGGASVLGYDGNAFVQVKQVSGSSVTVGALPSGALTTRFGSVTTANTAQITSAVTNTSRKYLLAQNISAGTVTIGIGFSPTTTQGIQLTAGAGLTFDSFCPTGAVFWLGAVTGAAFTILEN